MIGRVLASYGSLTAMRVGARICEFLLRAYLIRTVLDESIVGHMINLDLILTVSLHFAKGCLKPSYQKVESGEHAYISASNMMSLGVILTALSAIAIGILQDNLVQRSTPYFRETILCYCLSAVMESIYQRYNTQNVLGYHYFRTGAIEMASMLPKTLFVFLAAQTTLFSKYGILVFGAAQLLYSFLLALLSWMISTRRSLLPEPYIYKSVVVYLDPLSKTTLKQFAKLSVVKLVLQQFEKISLVLGDIARDSSIYSLISNLGSIVVRYIFAPLQEIFFNYFSRGTQAQSLSALLSFVRSLLLFSILSVSYGYNYSESFLLMIYGPKWVNGEAVIAMRTYAVLLSIMGLNGILQAYLLARGGESICLFKYYSTGTTLVYLATSGLFMHWQFGTAGMFLANIFNMACRLAVTWNLEIKKHLTLTRIYKQAFPSLSFILTSLLLFWVGTLSTLHSFASDATVFLLGGCLFALNLLPIAVEHSSLILSTLKAKLS